MSIIDFIAVVSFGLACFGLGYTLGKDTVNAKKYPPRPDKSNGYFFNIKFRINRLSVTPLYR